MLKKLAAIWGYIIYLFFILLLIDFIIYKVKLTKVLDNNRENTAHIKEEGELKVPSNMSDKTMNFLGDITTDRGTSFTNFEPEKPPGSIRIGCFGDSYTYGDEVVDGYDYPAFLQRMFEGRGYQNVQVINFGSQWYGFYQAYQMWEEFGKKYDLDYVLLGPKGFYINRDMTFNHTDEKNIYYVHGKYILKNDSLRPIFPLGGLSYKKRMNSYYSFVPKWRYLRYDRQPPMFLRILVPEGRDLKNPFYYYQGSIDKEMSQIYKRLISKIADETPIVMTLYNDLDRGKVYSFMLRNNFSNFKANYLSQNATFPYLAILSHNSSFGNKKIAEYMFNSLMEDDNFLNKLKNSFNDTVDVYSSNIITELKTRGKFNYGLPLANISTYNKLRFEINEQKVGVFTEKDSYEVVGDLKTKSLLCIRSKKMSIMDGDYLPVDLDLDVDMPIYALDEKSGKKTQLEYVYLNEIDKNLGLFELINDGFYYGNSDVINPGCKIKIIIGNREILSLTQKNEDEKLNIKPVNNHKLIRVGVPPSAYFELNKGQKKDIYLVMEKSNKIKRILFAEIIAYEVEI
jgi:hypothetical protein